MENSINHLDSNCNTLQLH